MPSSAFNLTFFIQTCIDESTQHSALMPMIYRCSAQRRCAALSNMREHLIQQHGTAASNARKLMSRVKGVPGGRPIFSAVQVGRPRVKKVALPSDPKLVQDIRVQLTRLDQTEVERYLSWQQLGSQDSEEDSGIVCASPAAAAGPDAEEDGTTSGDDGGMQLPMNEMPAEPAAHIPVPMEEH